MACGSSANEIAINQWLADDLQAKPGDEIAVTYYIMGLMRELIERIPFLFLAIGKHKFRTPRDKDRRSVIPLIKVTVVDLCRPERMAVVCSHL